MTLPSSGGLTIAQILAEIGDSFPVTIPNANWRTLAGKPTGPLVIPTDFYGKSWRSITQTDSRMTAANSFSSVSFGADVTGRAMILLVFHGDTNNNPGLTPTATIGGVSATRYQPHSTGDDTSGSDATGTSIFIAQPSGTSGTVGVTWGSLAVRIVVLRVAGYSVAPSASWGGSSSSLGRPASINVPANGALVMAVGAGQNSSSITYTGVTKQFEGIGAGYGGANNVLTYGWDYNLSSQTGRSIDFSPSSTAQGSNSWSGICLTPL